MPGNPSGNRARKRLVVDQRRPNVALEHLEVDDRISHGDEAWKRGRMDTHHDEAHQEACQQRRCMAANGRRGLNRQGLGLDQTARRRASSLSHWRQEATTVCVSSSRGKESSPLNGLFGVRNLKRCCLKLPQGHGKSAGLTRDEMHPEPTTCPGLRTPTSSRLAVCPSVAKPGLRSVSA